MSINNALKILKPINGRCEDCDAKELFLIKKDVEIDGVIYTKKYIYCRLCGYEEEYKIKSKSNENDDQLEPVDINYKENRNNGRYNKRYGIKSNSPGRNGRDRR